MITRPKLQTPPYNELNYEHCDADIEDLLLIHQLYFPEVTVRRWDPLDPITDDTDAIIEYSVLPTPSYFDDYNDVGVSLPMNVRAVITQHTMRRPREDFNESTDMNFYAMDVGRDRPVSDYDERGHMIAARLGGSAAPYNIFPQTRTLNRGTGSLWNTMERQIAAWVRSDPNRYAIMTVALSYDINADMTIIHRPIGVAVRVEAHDTRTGNTTFYDIATQTAVLPGQPNPHRNMFFSNEDNNICQPPANNG